MVESLPEEADTRTKSFKERGETNKHTGMEGSRNERSVNQQSCRIKRRDTGKFPMALHTFGVPR